jgi:serine/threonine-protein kinase
MPRILMSNGELEDIPVPIARPSTPEMPTDGDRQVPLHLFGEIARGGMGAILNGRDVALGRDLAVKILLEKHRDKPALIRRFIGAGNPPEEIRFPAQTVPCCRKSP